MGGGDTDSSVGLSRCWLRITFSGDNEAHYSILYSIADANATTPKYRVELLRTKPNTPVECRKRKQCTSYTNTYKYTHTHSRIPDNKQ